MKILVPVTLSENEQYLTDFVEHLSLFSDVTCSISDFWNMQGDYDILHLHWQEYLFNWQEPTDIELLFLQHVLNYWKKKSKIVITRHNFYPHFKNSEQFRILYATVLGYADAVIHLGQFSKNEYLERYKEYEFLKTQIQTVIPLPFFTKYENNSTQSEARKKLNISDDKFVIFVFGNIRDIAESNLVLNGFKELALKNKYLLATRWFYEKRPSVKLTPIKYLEWKINSLKLDCAKNICITNRYIPNNETQYYLNASDVVFISRIESLNSAVLPLAFYFKKIVVGPNCGNIGEILRENGNPIYDPTKQSVASALEKSYNLLKNGIGDRNFDNVKDRWCTEKIYNDTYKFYEELLSCSYNA